MAILAIRGHKERGKEVIEILEMLGGKNNNCLNGVTIGLYYFIEDYTVCSCEKVNNDYTVFTLEQFLEKFPYKVGDKVKVTPNGASIIKSMRWSYEDNSVKYKVDGTDYYFDARTLQPYIEQKEENMEEKENLVVVKNEHKQLKIHSLRYDRVQLMIDDKYELIQEEDAYYIVRRQPQYPKTYEECCIVIENACMTHKGGYRGDLVQSFQKLLICRDAYWKIAGEKMGLGKPWVHDWTNSEFKYCIKTIGNKVEHLSEMNIRCILAFPTAEIRDVFYENFKGLIEECKELL